MQRAFVALLKGNFAESISSHPALIPLLFTFLFTGLQLIFRWDKGARVIMISFATSVAIMIVNYLLKIA
jgi:hypothetical protein